MPLRAQPPQGCASANFATSALTTTRTSFVTKVVRLPIPPPPQVQAYLYIFAIYFLTGAAGAFWGTAGAEFCTGFRLKSGSELVPALRVAAIESEIDVTINRIAEIVVAFESNVADPRGPKAVWDPIPPNAPAKSAALPLCSSTTTIKNRHTITCTVTNRIPITTPPV